MKKRRRRTPGDSEYKDIELNIMPFIDVFSMLNTFLLFSAVFVAIGIHEVQVPFLSNAAPPKAESGRFLNINIDVMKGKVEVATAYSTAPPDEQKWTFDLTDPGMTDMHRRLVALRSEHKDIDKVTLFADEEVPFKDLTKVLDSVKLRRDGDPFFPEKDETGATTTQRGSLFLYPKVVMGSVLIGPSG